MKRSFIGAILILAIAGCDNSPEAKADKPGATPVATPTTPKPADAVKPADAAKPVATPASASPAAAAPTSGPPQWQCAGATFDFGSCWSGTKLTHKYEFENRGGETLKILQTIPKCGCSLAKDYPRELAPGQKGVFEFALNTTGKSGQISENINVKTNDPQRPEMLLVMNGSVRTVIKHEVMSDEAWIGAIMSPQAKENLSHNGGGFGTIRADEKLRRLVKFTNATGKPLTLKLQPVDAGAHFKVEFKETKPQDEWELKIASDPPHPQGQLYLNLHFDTNVPEVPIYDFPIQAYQAPRVDIQPPQLVYDPLYKSSNVRTIVVTNHGINRFDVVSLGVSDPALKVSMFPPRTVGNKQQFVIQIVSPNDNYRPPEWGELIRLQTTDAERPVIDIPIVPHWNKPADLRPKDHPLNFTAGQIMSMPAQPGAPTSAPAAGPPAH